MCALLNRIRVVKRREGEKHQHYARQRCRRKSSDGVGLPLPVCYFRTHTV